MTSSTHVVRVTRPDSLPPTADRFVVVEASAGTGKTYFLEHRVVDLILSGADLRELLVVTFTDKAVAELRMRIRDVLDRLSRVEADSTTASPSSWMIDHEARRRLRAAVAAFDHAPIFTIHGFCHRILVEDAFAARRLFDQTQVADEIAFDEAFTAVLRERFARVQPDRDLLAAFLAAGHTVIDLRDLLLRCARLDAPVRGQHDPQAVRAAVIALHDALGTDAQRRSVLALFKNGTDRRYVENRLDKLAHAFTGGSVQRSTAELLAMLDDVRKDMRELHERVVARGVAAATGPVITALEGVSATLSLHEAIATEMLPHVLERVGRDKAERGLFDYDDMLELVGEALRGERGDELARRLRARTPWAMIDEFQDTDPVQWRIFRTVWTHPDARGLTIVGDPKQAIYGFRGADVATYLLAREELLAAGGTRISLTVNRRSTEPLVTAVNHVLIGNLACPLLDQGDISYDAPVAASGDVVSDDRRAPIRVLHVVGTKGVKEALALAIGDEIEALHRDPPSWTLRGNVQPFAMSQVMVLTRANRDSLEIANALRARGLPCALVEPERLFETREASELASVLAAVAAPRDRAARIRALRTRFFDVPWCDLASVVDGPDHQPHIARLFEWAQLATRRAYESLFRHIVEDSRFAERALVLGGGERALTNTWHLIELLLGDVARSRGDLNELVTQLRRWMADDAAGAMQFDDRDVQRAETDLDAIRILTIHKAKGLEAPYVFLYGGTQGGSPSNVQALRDQVGRHLVVGARDPAVKALLEAQLEGENQRLAYVALTRAQVRLCLPLYAEGHVKSQSGYAPIQRCLARSVSSRAAQPRALFDVVTVEGDRPARVLPPRDALATFVAPAAPQHRDLVPLPSSRAGLAMVSYTRLANDVDAARIAAAPGDVLAIDPAELRTDDTLGEVAPNELPPGASSGLLLHDVLEHADLDAVGRRPGLDAWTSAPAVRAMLELHASERGIAALHVPHAAAVAYRTLTEPLELLDGTQLPALVDATAIAREVEFAYPLPGSGHGLVKGFIDALVAYGDDLWVLDYKSDLLAGDDPRRAADVRVREHYAIQARLYALAAERLRGSRRLAGLLFAFVRYGVVVPIRVDAAALAGWSAWLGALPVGGREAQP